MRPRASFRIASYWSASTSRARVGELPVPAGVGAPSVTAQPLETFPVVPEHVPGVGGGAVAPPELGALQLQLGDRRRGPSTCCLLYTSDAADERSSVDLGG